MPVTPPPPRTSALSFLRFMRHLLPSRFDHASDRARSEPLRLPAPPGSTRATVGLRRLLQCDPDPEGAVDRRGGGRGAAGYPDGGPIPGAGGGRPAGLRIGGRALHAPRTARPGTRERAGDRDL